MKVDRRPRASRFVELEVDNAYQELGVSPLASTAEIVELIRLRQKKAKLRTRASTKTGFGAEEDLVHRLERLREKIGTDEARRRYDELHPATQLLTVQAGPRDRFDDPANLYGLVSAYLDEEFGGSVLLPTVLAELLWIGDPLDSEVSGFLMAHACTHATGAPDERATSGTDRPLGPEDFDRLSEKLRDGSANSACPTQPPSAAEEPSNA